MKRVLLRRASILLAGAISLAGAFVAVAYFFVMTRTGQLFDQRAFNGAEFGQRSVAPVTNNVLDAVPITGVAVALAVAIVVTVFRKNFAVLVTAVAVAGAANIATQVIKNVILVRPDHGIAGYAANSLPSGHTTLAASSVLVVFLVSSPALRPAVGSLGALFTAAVGVSTLSNQWHRPSDVVAALLLVAFFACVAGLILLPSRVTEEAPRRDLWSRALLLLALPCAGLAGVTLLVSAFATFAYIGAAAAIITCVLLLTAAINHAFRNIL
jgi:PAP2 superfamily